MTVQFQQTGPAGPALLIQGYAGRAYRVAGTLHDGGLIITPERVLPWQPPPPASLTLDDFAPVVANQPPIEVLLLGTGARLVLPSRELRDAVQAAGLSLDCMDSRAAARTYNLLVGEHRRVAAALYPLD